MVQEQHPRTQSLILKWEAAYWEWCRSFETSNIVPVTHPFQQNHTSYPFPNSSSNYEPSIQTYKSMEVIFIQTNHGHRVLIKWEVTSVCPKPILTELLDMAIPREPWWTSWQSAYCFILWILMFLCSHVSWHSKGHHNNEQESAKFLEHPAIQTSSSGRINFNSIWNSPSTHFLH